ncbi:MAG: hypothetical protein E1N59_3157 [Puniceicoccaceae bacterium 5H]|nr:MAG: hypothetical protein E1N59_3157 [Puniceicoccaceae bacterium 5H]
MACEQAAAVYGESAMRLEELKKHTKRLCEEQHVRRLDLFGSRARHDARKGSDYDFVAEFEQLAPEEFGRYYFDLLHGLEDMLHAPVDLLTYEGIRKPALRENIERQRVKIYERQD